MELKWEFIRKLAVPNKADLRLRLGLQILYTVYNIPYFKNKKNCNKLLIHYKTGIKSLEYFEDYFGIKYPLSKCDMIAIPDFKFGAMENWGLSKIYISIYI